MSDLKYNIALDLQHKIDDVNKVVKIHETFFKKQYQYDKHKILDRFATQKTAIIGLRKKVNTLSDSVSSLHKIATATIPIDLSQLEERINNNNKENIVHINELEEELKRYKRALRLIVHAVGDIKYKKLNKILDLLEENAIDR